MTLSIYKHESITKLLTMLSASIVKLKQKEHLKTFKKITSLIKETKTRDLSDLQAEHFHRLIRKFS